MKFIFCLISLFLIPGSAIEFYTGLIRIFNSQELWAPLTIGFGVGLIVSMFIIRYLRWLTTFDHELTHALMALIFLRRIKRFIVTSSHGGYVEHSGGFGGEFGNLIITAAPYFLPTFSIIAVLFIPLIGPETFYYYLIFVGFTLIYHIVSTIEETYRGWSKKQYTDVLGETCMTDIGSLGYIAAFLSITGFTLFCYGIIFVMLRYEYAGIWPFWKSVCVSSWNIYYDLSVWVISATNDLMNNYF